MSKLIKIYDVIKFPSLTEESILNYLSYQPKSDYREPINIKKLIDKFAVEVTFEESDE